MNPDVFAADVFAALRARARPERAEAVQADRPTADECLGLTAGEVREVVKDAAKRVRREAAEGVVELADLLAASGVFEARLAAYELLGRHRAARASLDADALLRLGRGMDNWLGVDTFATHLSGVVWREGNVTDADVLGWTASEDRWWRRAGVVSTVALNLKARGGTGDPRRTLLICGRVIDERDPMIVKALSWALRTLVPHDPTAVRRFLDEHAERLPKLVLRETRRKLESGRKR